MSRRGSGTRRRHKGTQLIERSSTQTGSTLAAPSARPKVRWLQIRTLGRCELKLGDRLIPDAAWLGPHAKRLLLILVSFGRGSLVPRDELIDLLRSAPLTRGREEEG